MEGKMKNVIVYYDPDFTVKVEDEAPIPEFSDTEVLIRVHAASSNPKDWKHPHPAYFNVQLNQGDDAAGTVAAVGKLVKHFKPGDRVAGFHVMDTPRGAYAPYCVCPENTVFHIPDTLSYEEASTIPLAAFTAAVGLWRNLGLGMPGQVRTDEKAELERPTLVVNGAGGAVGAFVVKLAKASGAVGKIVAIAGASKEFVEACGADVVLDYRKPSIADELKAALGGKKVKHVFDATNSVSSIGYLTPSMDRDGGRYTCTTGITAHKLYPDAGRQKQMLEAAEVWHEQIWVGSVHDDKPVGGRLFGSTVSRVFEELLGSGKLTGHPYEVIPGGLAGVETGLRRLKDRKGGDNRKLVYRIDDTPGL